MKTAPAYSGAAEHLFWSKVITVQIVHTAGTLLSAPLARSVTCWRAHLKCP